MRLIPKLCQDGIALFYFGWDQQGEFVNIRLFFNSELERAAERAAAQAMRISDDICR
jgi:hypothetical protein